MEEQIQVIEGTRLVDLPIKPESLAFIVYMMRITDEIKLDLEEIIFCPCDVKFGAGRAEWVTIFLEEKGSGYIEYWIICINGKPSSVVTREIDRYGNKSLCIAQLVLNPISEEGVTKLINDLPNAELVVRRKTHLH